MMQLITTEDLDALKKELIEEFNELKLIVSGVGFPTPEKRWLKSADIKQLLQISHGKLQKMRDSGQIPHKKVDGVIFYDLREVERILNER